MNTYNLTLVRVVLSKAQNELENAKDYSIQAGVPDTRRLDKLIQSVQLAKDAYGDLLRQCVELEIRE